MAESPEIIIRKFNQKDRAAVRKISVETAFMGEASSRFFDAQEIIADALTLYFTDYEPESCFVAEQEGRVVGYLTGAKDTQRISRVFGQSVGLKLFFKAMASAVFFKRKNLEFIFNFLKSLFRREFKMPSLYEGYPATLHMNIEAPYRGRGIGEKLLSAFLDYLAKENVRGVYLATMSEAGKNFFRKQGFALVHQSKRSYFRYLLGSDTDVHIFAKRLLEKGGQAEL